ncbi:MAG: cryptochrome/photolyase family protein, partial [Pseudomonadota bacterium]
MILILGNQLFPPECLSAYQGHRVFMSEDMGLCTYERHHQQKIVLFLAAMRSYADELRAAGFEVHYEMLDVHSKHTYEARLKTAMHKAGTTELIHFEIEDKPFEARVEAMVTTEGFTHTVIPSPMFSCDRERFAQFIDGKKRLLMGDFYKQQRHRLDILIDANGEPVGGQYSYDADNRKKLPRNIEPPVIDAASRNEHVVSVIELVSEQFPDHPGSAGEFWWPTTREEARSWLTEFVEQRLESFGPYEDAMTTRSSTVFHSVLSPMINMGLLLPDEVVDAVVQRAGSVPLSSVEGFVRQVIGWREFIRGIYQNFSEQQDEGNFWSHERELTDDWYDATTGIVPLDDAIKTAQSLGWA